ncbi:unnamed protein product [Arctia plantaginis]|uniref:Uncharacterized protein n=1 Tax=Arctia plantaginis TaxID=874455 RepID=A0A8S0YLV8_ARCPL|nr:unnamed protein product [Arctia plantaginis]CAB3246149.1 unnamed protein product [Arctia plantaginis]
MRLPDTIRSRMIIPVSKNTYFNTKWTPVSAPLCAYDMLFHPPDYNPKSSRSDRQEPKIIRRNIWQQETKKTIASTIHLQYGRPAWKPFDLPTKLFVRSQVKNENPHMRIHHALKWATILCDGKPSLCD